MNRRSTRALLGLAVLLLVLAGLAPASSASRFGMGGGGGSFKVKCQYVKSGQFDPIVSPGAMSHHLHTFMGNKKVNKNSDSDQLRQGREKCNVNADESAYWAPAVIDLATGEEVIPVEAHLYYLARGKTDMVPFPDDLQMITPAGTGFIFDCRGPGESSMTEFPDCGGSGSTIRYEFGDCSDGRSDSADHRSHLVYSIEGECPASHPIPMPQLDMIMIYPVQLSTATHRLSSGEFSTAHADFMNGWDVSVMTQLIDDCMGTTVQKCR